MASTLTFLIVSAVVVFSGAQAELSKHNANKLMKMTTEINNEVKDADCLNKYKAKVTVLKKDSDFLGLCTSGTSTVKCAGNLGKKVDDIVCKYVEASKDELAKVKKAYDAANISAKCQGKVGKSADFTSWSFIESLCEKITKTKKAEYEKECPNDLSKVKTALLCSAAPAILSGLATLGLCLIATLFNKM